MVEVIPHLSGGVMNRIFFFVIAAAFALAINATSFAQVEPIGPIVVVPNQTIDLFYPNVFDLEHHKIVRFVGRVEGLIDSPTGVGLLDIGFDYIDPAGGLVLVSPPVSSFDFSPGAVTPIDTGELILPFCPQQVSIHFGTRVGHGQVTGDFSHICIVPDPASAGVLGLAAFGLLGRRMRR
jgi:hypothetical protein